MRAICLAVAACSLLAIACGGGSSSSGPIWERPGYEAHIRPEWGPPQPGDAAPDIALPRADGTAYRLADDRGHWVVLHFTTTWCPFCDEEIDHLDQLAAHYEAQQVRVLLVDVLETPDAWREYLTGRLPAGKLVSLVDEQGTVAASYAPTRAAPSFENRSHVVLASTIIVDPTGHVRFFVMPDSRDFDPTFRVVYESLDRLMAGGEP